MNNYNLTTAVKDYALVGELVVKLTKNKSLAYWNSATVAELLVEHGLRVKIFKRQLALGFMKIFDEKMVKKFNMAFGKTQLLDNIAKAIDIGDLSGYSKKMWLRYFLDGSSDSATVVSGTGFDFVQQTTVNSTPNGNLSMVKNSPAFNFSLLCQDAVGFPAKVAVESPCRVHLAFVKFGLDDPKSGVPEIAYHSFEIEVDGNIQLDSQSIGMTIPEPETYTYVVARIEVLEANVKGVKKSKEKGKFDTLQVVGCRL